MLLLFLPGLGFYSSCVPMQALEENWGSTKFPRYVATLCPTFLILAGVLYLVLGCCGGTDFHDHRKALAAKRGAGGGAKGSSRASR